MKGLHCSNIPVKYKLFAYPNYLFYTHHQLTERQQGNLPKSLITEEIHYPLAAEKTYKYVSFSALTFYCLAKSYSFFTGANHIPIGIPLGNAGDIISSGLILPLNICVGLVVACTMYAFYTLFKKGGM